MVPINYYIILSAIMFTIGVAGVLIRRNALIIFMSIELMLNAANLAIVAFSSILKTPEVNPVVSGKLLVFFVIAVAQAEVAVGLALIVEIFKSKHSIDVDQLSSLKG